MVWPFKKRQKKDAGGERRPSSEKEHPRQPAGATALAASPTTTSSPVRRRSSRAGPKKKAIERLPAEALQRQASTGQENMPRGRGSVEDITALPVSRRLDSSPHLRQVDLQRPPIPYNFRPHSASQTSIQRTEAKPSRPQTLRSRRSGYDSGSPVRRRSSKRRKDDYLREEEIRAMSAPIPIPKRPGEGPLRRDSKKLRSLGGARDSTVSLPPQGSIHSSMSGIMEQRGWEVGSFDVFSARPHVRLSGTPTYTYVSPSSILSASNISRDQPTREKKMKRPETRESAKKRQTIGEEADEFDASDLRMLLERDAKRRERRKKEQQEKIDRKLRSRAARNRGDSDRKHRDAEETQSRTEEQGAREVLTPPTDVHPALRDRPTVTEADVAGLGIGASRDIEQSKSEQTVTPQDPFADPVPPSRPSESELEAEHQIPVALSPVQTPLEDPTVHTARAVRLSQTYTPPLSPIRPGQMERVPSGLVQSTSASDLPDPIPIAVPERKISASRERRPGAWASLFRRGTNFRKDIKTSPSQGSFSNTSRESMRNQPLPAHLVDNQHVLLRRTSGTPVRTQSKFREDLPEMPISPPDSRMPSPDVTAAAATAAAARRRHSPVPMDIPGAENRESDPDHGTHGRNDTPISPSIRGHGLMSASLASVDSEGSWLASSTKRQSSQSALSRGMGSLSRRNQDFVGSYEELGGDRDAEYVARRASSPALTGHRVSNPALVGPSPDEESEYSEMHAAESLSEPLAVHGSVRRQPTLVRRDPRVKSREGLLTEISTEPEDAEDSPISATGRSDFEEISEPSDTLVQSARSVNYGKGHARQMSAGSARLMDIKRPSVEAARGAGDAALKRASRTSQP